MTMPRVLLTHTPTDLVGYYGERALTGLQAVAEVRLRWSKRLTPAQVAKVERELGRLPGVLTKLGFGTVQVERSFVRRRKN